MNRYVKIAIILTILTFSTGLFFGSLQAKEIMKIARILLNIRGNGGDLNGNIQNLTQVEKIIIFIHIFIRNTIVSILNISLGPLYGIFPIFTLLFNGYLIGGVITEISRTIGIRYAALGILPHGIIEIPAFLYSAILGLRLGLIYSKKLFEGYDDSEEFIQTLWKGLKIIIPMLLLAAFIEAFITSQLLS